MTPEEEGDTYKRIVCSLTRELKKLGDHTPQVDRIQVSIIARAFINMKKSETLLDADTATEHTHVRIADCQSKYAKIINTALSHLALSRRSRMSNATETELMTKLTEAFLRASKNATQSN